MKTVMVTVFCEQTGFRSPRKYKPVSFASRLDSNRIAKKRIIHHCLFCEQTGFRSHCKETDYTPLSFASRPDSGRIAKKRIIHHCLFCKQTGFRSHCKETDYTPLSFAAVWFQSHCKETDYTPFARRLETSTFYHEYINFGNISYINTYLDFSSPFFS